MYNFCQFLFESNYVTNKRFYLNRPKYDVTGIENRSYKDIEIDCSEDDNYYYFWFKKSEKKYYDYYVYLYKKRGYILFDAHKYIWKFILAVIYKYVNDWEYDTICFETLFSHIDIREQINNILENINGFYIVYYTIKGNYKRLIFTKDKKYYDKVIRKCEYENSKILYKNENLENTEKYFDSDKLKNEQFQSFKNIQLDDIYFDENLELYFKDKNLDELFIKLNGVRFKFVKSKKENPFDRYIGHRFHVKNGLTINMRGLGLGLKIYKSFLKYQGYLVSDKKVSDNARSVYKKLIKEPNYTKIFDIKNNRLMIINKDYVYYQRVLSMLKKFEKENNLEFIYDYYH